MVCIYCGSPTQVVNSRHQKKANQVWRRRECKVCHAVFTTLEGVDTTLALQVRKTSASEAFSRDTLLLSIYDSLRHRKTAVQDATALTGTILTQLYPLIDQATIESEAIKEVATAVLNNFDKAAATHYQAFHPVTG